MKDFINAILTTLLGVPFVLVSLLFMIVIAMILVVITILAIPVIPFLIYYQQKADKAEANKMRQVDVQI